MSRELLLEKRNNPNYNALYSGKNSLDNDYGKMMDHDQDLNAQLNSEKSKLYAKYRNFQDGRKKRRKSRDRMLKSVLQKASFENNFIGNALPKNLRGNPKVELGNEGIKVRDENKEIEEQKLMGMKNLKDLKSLDIGKQISKRERMLRERNERYFEKSSKKFRSPRERKLSENTPKMVKHVRGVGSQSFLLRNDKINSRKGSFKSERGLKQVRSRKRRKRNRKNVSFYKKDRGLKTKPSAKKKTKKTPPKKKPKKKFKQKYRFDWRKLKWVKKFTYKYKLITSLKDLKFWKSMGIRIKKHKVSLFYKWENNRKHNSKQENCVLTARFSPLIYFYDVKYYYAKATFKSNCENYTVEKLFKAYHNYGKSFIIYIGKLRFSVQYHHQNNRRGWYNYQYQTMKSFPRYQAKTFNPYKKRSDYVKFKLAPSTALKWKNKRFKLFLKFQHHYPTKSEKFAYAEKKRLDIKNWKKNNGNRPYPRKLKQVEKKVEKKEEIKTPKERNLKQTSRSLRRRRIHWRHRWQNIWRYGYRDVLHDNEIIIPRNAVNPIIPRSTIKRLWTSTKYFITCHGSSHRKTCRI